MMERRFEIRWEISKTLIHNASLKDKVKRNKKTIVEAIKIASYLNDECVQKRNSNTVNQIFFGESTKIEPRQNIWLNEEELVLQQISEGRHQRRRTTDHRTQIRKGTTV